MSQKPLIPLLVGRVKQPAESSQLAKSNAGRPSSSEYPFKAAVDYDMILPHEGAHAPACNGHLPT
jgi:hypothetical protein